ncbi:MAG TPA: sugar phosphate isomerase/epimerase [Armatimonadota bacterium]|jgi:sugar phosphate isomerase/epimerase
MKLPYKTAVISDEIAQDVTIAADTAREYDLDALEIRGAWGKGPHQLDAGDISKIRDITGSRGLAVCSVAPPFFKCDLDDAQAATDHLEILRRSCATAHALDTNLVRGFAFFRRGPMDPVKDRIVACLRAAAEIVEGEGAILALENEYSTYNCNVARTLELIEAVGSDSVQLLYDPGNDVHDEEGEVAWPDSYNLAIGKMVHMHLKDPKRNADGTVTTLAIGDGDIHAREMLAALAGSGYTGYVSLETHYRREPLSHELTRLPSGDDFSAGGWVASRECLDRWFEIARTV